MNKQAMYAISRHILQQPAGSPHLRNHRDLETSSGSKGFLRIHATCVVAELHLSEWVPPPPEVGFDDPAGVAGLCLKEPGCPEALLVPPPTPSSPRSLEPRGQGLGSLGSVSSRWRYQWGTEGGWLRGRESLNDRHKNNLHQSYVETRDIWRVVNELFCGVFFLISWA